MSFVETMKEKARQNIKTILLPESEDIRVIQAAADVEKEGFAKAVLIGNEENVKKLALDNNIDVSKVTIIDPLKSEKFEEYSNKFYELRKAKGMTPEKAKEMLDYTGCDAIMIGRAAQGNPWIFKRVVHYLETGEILEKPSINEKIDIAINHLHMLVEYKGEYIGIREMRKHLGWYIKGMPKSSEMRVIINGIEDSKKMEDLLLSMKQ